MQEGASCDCKCGHRDADNKKKCAFVCMDSLFLAHVIVDF